MAKYKIEEEKAVKVPKKKMKEYIKKINGWNDEQYRKNYDIFKNKLRAYENYRRAHGAKVETQSPADILYKQAKSKERQGASYEPSLEMKRIYSFSSVSITKGKKLAQNKESLYTAKRNAIFEDTTSKQFAGFIKSVPQAKEIYDKIKDPVLREEALKDLAEALHYKKKEIEEMRKKEKENGTPADSIPYGEATGSDAVDFDVDAWIEENGI